MGIKFVRSIRDPLKLKEPHENYVVCVASGSGMVYELDQYIHSNFNLHPIGYYSTEEKVHYGKGGGY